MAKPDRYWVDRVLSDAQARLARDKATMKGKLGRPVLRRQSTADILKGALMNPGSLEPMGRERLGDYLTRRYGSAARFVFPYLGLDESGHEIVEEAPPQPAMPPPTGG